LEREIDQVAAVKDVNLGRRWVDCTPNTKRVLEVEIPRDTIAAEMVGRPKGDPMLRQQFRQEAAAALAYAKTRGVELNFVEASE
jgi:hypothetical protein